MPALGVDGGGRKSIKEGWRVEGEDGGRPCLYRSVKGASAG